MPTLAVLAAVAALATGVVLSTVDARHHHKSSHQTTTAGPSRAELMQQTATADSIRAMKVAKGVRHSDVCPRNESSVDACFVGTLASPAQNVGDASAVAGQMLTALNVTLGPALSCEALAGGPWGSGFDCTATATWQEDGAPIDTFVFVTSQAQRTAGAPALEAMLTVLPSGQ